MDQTAVPVPPQAEVDEVWPRGGEISIRGTAVGADSVEGTLLIRARGPQVAELRLPASGQGTRFETRISLDSLARASTAERQTWDLYLDLRGHAEPLRLGRHLDDVVGKKDIFTYPAQSAAGLRIKPYYTVKDNLSISCRREHA